MIVGSVLLSIMVLLWIIAVWQTFAAEYFSGLRSKYLEGKNARDKIAKIAQVKLVSDDRKEIEKFVTDNANYLSNETVKLLVARIEAIKDDRVIADDNLKVRFEELDNNSQPEYQPPAGARPGRKSA